MCRTGVCTMCVPCVGLVCVPGAVGGNIVGGWFIKRMRLNLKGLLRYYLIGQVIILTIIWTPFVIYCDSTLSSTPAPSTNGCSSIYYYTCFLTLERSRQFHVMTSL